MKIGLFYGSDTGRTTAVAEQIKETLGDKLNIDMHDCSLPQNWSILK